MMLIERKRQRLLIAMDFWKHNMSIADIGKKYRVSREKIRISSNEFPESTDFSSVLQEINAEFIKIITQRSPIKDHSRLKMIESYLRKGDSHKKISKVLSISSSRVGQIIANDDKLFRLNQMRKKTAKKTAQ